MVVGTKIRLAVILAFLFCLVPVNTGLTKTKKKPAPKGTPVMWRQPVDISSRDLFLGPGGARMRPDLRKITFIKEEKGGWSKKYRIRDGSGREWVAKLGKEAQSETSAVRLLWGIGYLTEINYLVPRVTIPGKGTFQNVRFEARPENWDRLDDPWKWKENPFVGTHEYQGLKIMMALLNNWDLKDSNNLVVFDKNKGNELEYMISDLGATFGHASSTPFFWRITRSRNNPDKYARSEFFEKVKGDRVVLHYGGKNRGLMKDISVEEALWTGRLLAQLSDRQIKEAFRAANYTPAQINLLAQEVMARRDELLRLRPSVEFRRGQ
jgi:hypothetical protein